MTSLPLCLVYPLLPLFQPSCLVGFVFCKDGKKKKTEKERNKQSVLGQSCLAKFEIQSFQQTQCFQRNRRKNEENEKGKYGRKGAGGGKEHGGGGGDETGKKSEEEKKREKKKCNVAWGPSPSPVKIEEKLMDGTCKKKADTQEAV